MARLLLRHPLHFTDIRELFTHHERDVLGSILAITKAVAGQLGKQVLDKQKRRIDAEATLRECGDNPCPDCPPISLTVPDELQDTLWRCGPAALRAVCRFHEIDASENLLARIAGTSITNGTSPEMLERAANRLGLVTDARSNSCLDDVAHALRLGAPCICAVQTDGGGHWVVAKGIDDKNVTLMDPLQGTTTETRAAFEQRWWDHANGKKYVRYALAIGKRKVKESVGAVGVGQLPGNPQSIARVMESGLLADLLPQEAIDYLRGLVVALGIDPAPLLPELRRNAFTLAVTTDSEILERVKSAIVDKLASGDVGSGAQAVQQVLDAAGLTSTNPGYASTVFRTNAMSAYNEAAQQQLNREIDTFPVWRYSNPDDSRSRPHHAEKDGKYYPSSVSFESVRGTGAADVCNCRCTQVGIYKDDWAELRASGARIADGYPDVVMESEGAFRLLEVKDAKGHEHAKDGRFGSQSGSHDKGEEKPKAKEGKPKAEAAAKPKASKPASAKTAKTTTNVAPASSGVPSKAAPKTKAAKAKAPAKAKAAPAHTVESVTAKAKEVTASPTREGLSDLAASLETMSLADMRKVRDAIGGDKGGRSKEDLKQRVKAAVEKKTETAGTTEKPEAKTAKKKTDKTTGEQSGKPTEQPATPAKSETKSDAPVSSGELSAPRFDPALAPKLADAFEFSQSRLPDPGSLGGNGIAYLPELQHRIKKVTGQDMPPEQFKALMDHLSQSGAVNLHILNEPKEIKSHESAYVIDRNDRKMAFAVIKDHGKLTSEMEKFAKGELNLGGANTTATPVASQSVKAAAKTSASTADPSAKKTAAKTKAKPSAKKSVKASDSPSSSPAPRTPSQRKAAFEKSIESALASGERDVDFTAAGIPDVEDDRANDLDVNPVPGATPQRMKVPISKIVTDSQGGGNIERIKEYAAGTVKNPSQQRPKMVHVNGTYYLVDGNHRLGGALLRGDDALDADVVEGTAELTKTAKQVQASRKAKSAKEGD